MKTVFKWKENFLEISVSFISWSFLKINLVRYFVCLVTSHVTCYPKFEKCVHLLHCKHFSMFSLFVLTSPFFSFTPPPIFWFPYLSIYFLLSFLFIYLFIYLYHFTYFYLFYFLLVCLLTCLFIHLKAVDTIGNYSK